jgi:hypothetical protein
MIILSADIILQEMDLQLSDATTYRELSEEIYQTFWEKQLNLVQCL